jgi:4-amino-4-deoxy-L-arabinose transferase-like glycosyltransferase
LKPTLLLLSFSKRVVKKENFPLFVIIALAFLLRFWNLGWNGFNGDESIYSGQAASLLGEEDFLKDFAVFRAHPLLLQSLVSVAFALFGVHDTVARYVPVVFGTLTVFVTYLLAKELFNRKVGLVSSLVLALLPFHIVFSRQVLLDVPLSFFVVLFLYFITKYKITERNIYSYWAGVSCGLCFISKEVGIIMLPIFVAYTLFIKTLKMNKLLIFLSGFGFGVVPFVILILTRQDAVQALFTYATFQVNREATMLSLRYSSTLINEAFGYALPILIIVSIFMTMFEWKIKESRKYKDQIILLILTLSTLFVFYQLLPSQGDRFLITLMPIGVILGCSFLVTDFVLHLKRRAQITTCFILIPLIVLSNNFFISKVFPVEDLKISDNLGTPWKREVALWIKDNTPPDANVLTAQMTMANVIRFYSNHEVYTFELSNNPSYVRLDNPALLILNKNVSIIVEDLDPALEQNSVVLELKKYRAYFNPELTFTAYKHITEDGSDKKIPMVGVYLLR